MVVGGHTLTEGRRIGREMILHEQGTGEGGDQRGRSEKQSQKKNCTMKISDIFFRSLESFSFFPFAFPTRCALDVPSLSCNHTTNGRD